MRRLVDFALAALALGILVLPCVLVALALFLSQGRPILYGSIRVGQARRQFRLWKFRTMHTSPADAGVTGGDKSGRITTCGAVLRRWRIDEWPQVWNVLRGDLALVGPRAPLPEVVAHFPDLYAGLLRDRPGLTGLASVILAAREGQMLGRCQTAAETEAVYLRRLVPRKARLDRIARHRRGAGLSALILIWTLGLMLGATRPWHRRRRPARSGRRDRRLASRLLGVVVRRKRAILWVGDAVSGAGAGLMIAVLTGVQPGLPVLAGAVAGALASRLTGLDRVKLIAVSAAQPASLASGAVVGLCVSAALGAGDISLPVVLGAGLVAGFWHISALRLARAAMIAPYRGLIDRAAPPVRVAVAGPPAVTAGLLAALSTDDTVRIVGAIDTEQRPGAETLPLLLAAIVRLKAGRLLVADPDLTPAQLAHLERGAARSGCELRPCAALARALAGTAAPASAAMPPTAARGSLRPGPTDAYRGRTVLISGAGGSVGSALARALLDLSPASIVLLETNEAALYAVDTALRADPRAPGITLVPVLGSVGDARLVRQILARHGVSVILHAAAHKHVPLVEANPLAAIANNVFGTLTLAEAAADVRVDRFVLISTDKAVDPASVMGATKRLAELALAGLARRAPATRFATVRFGNVTGSSGSVIPLFQQQIAAGGPLTLTAEDTTRYFMSMDEAAELVLAAGSLDQDTAGDAVLVLDMGAPLRIRDLAVEMIRAAGLSLRDAGNPGGDIALRITGLRPGERLHERPLLGPEAGATAHPKVRTMPLGAFDPDRLSDGLARLRAAGARGDSARSVAYLWSLVGRADRGRPVQPPGASVILLDKDAETRLAV